MVVDQPIPRLKAELEALHPSARYVRVEAIDLSAALDENERLRAALANLLVDYNAPPESITASVVIARALLEGGEPDANK